MELPESKKITAPEQFALVDKRLKKAVYEIDKKVETLKKKMAAEPTNWGIVGDLTYLTEQVEKAVGWEL